MSLIQYIYTYDVTDMNWMDVLCEDKCREMTLMVSVNGGKGGKS